MCILCTDSCELRMLQGQTLTDKEIVELWSTFKVGFPEGKLSKPQIMEVVRKVFPRCDADIVLRNIFRALDSSNSGKISPRDLMLTFTMAMTGTSERETFSSFLLTNSCLSCS